MFPSAGESVCETNERLPDVVSRLPELESIELVPFVEGWGGRGLLASNIRVLAHFETGGPSVK